jgi:O-antigen/teichoic acid export membrane protein
MSSDELTTVAQTAARGGIFLFVGKAVSTVVLAVGIIVVARLLGPSSYGLYTLSIVIPTLLISLSDLGMNSALIRLPARLMAEGNYTRAKRLIRLGFLLKLAISAVAFIICYIGAPTIATTLLNRPALVPYLRITSLMIVTQPLVRSDPS